jgi:PAS domain S-box-containing protein
MQTEHKTAPPSPVPPQVASRVILKYAVALASVFSAAVLARFMERCWHSTPYVSLFFCGIIASAWFGGFRPGLLASALSVLVFAYFFLPPGYSLLVNSNELPRLFLFAVSAVLVGLLCAAQRSNGESLQRARDELALKVQALNRANGALKAENAERKSAEDALRRVEAYLSEGQRLSHTGSWAWNVKTKENVFWSKEHFRIFGFDPEAGDKSYRAARDRMHPDDGPAFDAALDQAIRDRKDFEVQLRIILPGGGLKYIHTVGHPVINDTGELVEFIGTAMDITDRKTAEQALRAAQAELAHATRVMTMGELAASIAHEVNQPLTAVVNNANACLSLLPSGTPALSEVRDALAEIIDDAGRASEVLVRVRQWVRKAPLEMAPQNLRDIITEVLLLARYESASRQVTIDLDVSGEMPLISGDRVQLQQVLLNLIVNAMDAMNAVEVSKRVLTIRGCRRTQEDKVEVWVSVRDAGQGLAPGQTDRLFEPFYTTKPQGLGMGLAISRSIIEAHGGRLWAEPNAGPGATFRFSLPGIRTH